MLRCGKLKVIESDKKPGFCEVTGKRWYGRYFNLDLALRRARQVQNSSKPKKEKV